MKFVRIFVIVGAVLVLSACSGSKQDRQIDPPGPPTVGVSADIKQLIFSWGEIEGATHYRLLENPDGHSGFTQTGDDISAGTLIATKHIAVHLHDWVNALYMVQACNSAGCTGSVEHSATDLMLGSIGYFKASDTGRIGGKVALSADGSRMAASGGTGAYVFHFDGTSWSQEAEIEGLSSRSDIALSADGRTLALSGSTPEIGSAVYVFRLDGNDWIQTAYVLGSNTEADDDFGYAVALSADGNTLVVGAPLEDSAAKGINGDESDNSLEDHGAVYIFRFGGIAWTQQAYVKDSTDRDNCAWNPFYRPVRFGADIALAADGNTVAVGDFCYYTPRERGESVAQLYQYDGQAWLHEAVIEWGAIVNVEISADGNTLAIGDPERWVGYENGYVTLFRRGEGGWQRKTSVRPPLGNDVEGNYDDPGQKFGSALALGADGDLLAVGAYNEDSVATGINGDPVVTSANENGAAYLFQFDGINWAQRTYVKASTTDAGDRFGRSVALSADGSTLAVGAPGEDSAATGINGDQADNSAENTGAVYVY